MTLLASRFVSSSIEPRLRLQRTLSSAVHGASPSAVVLSYGRSGFSRNSSISIRPRWAEVMASWGRGLTVIAGGFGDDLPVLPDSIGHEVCPRLRSGALAVGLLDGPAQVFDRLTEHGVILERVAHG